VLEVVVDDIAVKVQLAGIFRSEFALLELDDHKCAQAQVVEKQIDVELLVSDIELVLPPDKSKPLAKLQQEFFQVADQFGFQLAFVERFGQGEEIENIGILEGLLHQVRLMRRQRQGEIGPGLAVPGMGLRLDLHRQNVPAPAVGKGLLHVPVSRWNVFDLFHQNNVMKPGNCPEQRGSRFCRRLRHFYRGTYFCRRLRQKCGRIGILPVKSNHPPDIALRKTLQFGHLVFQLPCQPWNDCRTPAFELLARANDAADVPIQADQL